MYDFGDDVQFPLLFNIWEFSKMGVPYSGGPYNKDPTI